MVAIVNISKKCAESGVHEYEVRINQKVITKFYHLRENSLAECLRLAAQAVDKRVSELEMKHIAEK